MSLKSEVFSLIKKIPAGKISTYGAVARALGKPLAARAVGNALNKNRDFVKISCHRVVRSDGKIGGYVLGEKEKTEKLRKEGIKIEKGSVINFEKYLYKF